MVPNGSYTEIRLSFSIQNDLCWEEWQARAHCGMDCSGIPHRKGTTKFISEYYIQADRNGVVKNVTVDPELAAYIHTSIMQWEPGMVIDNFRVDKLGFLFFQFPTEELQDQFCGRFTELIRVEME